MINDSGYFYTDEKGVEDKSRDFCLNSAGHYQLVTQPLFETLRPHGREDLQLLYIAKGSMTFEFNGRAQRVGEGSVVFYQKGDRQHYVYKLEQEPDVYWLHFTGTKAVETLKGLGMKKSGAYFTGPQSEFSILVQKMIRELQFQKNHYQHLATLYLEGFLILLARCLGEGEKKMWEQNALVEKAMTDFHQRYHQPLQVSAYARRMGVSSCWLIRCFKNYTGKTPMRYISEIRMSKAKEMLYSSAFTIGEIALSLGYADPLYFSRMFKKMVGLSPGAYRKQVRGQ